MPINEHELLADMLTQYCERVRDVAAKQGLQVILANSIFNPATGDIFTNGISSVVQGEDYAKIAFVQGLYVGRIYDENYKK